jgi:SNF2 family DNA or RNA helicase
MSIIISKANKALVVSDDSLELATARLPDGRFVIPHTARNTILLRHQGHKVPNPMLMHYDWRGGIPFISQKITCEMLSENPRAYVLNDMGTGKTRATLWAWDYLNQEGAVGKLLVVCKKSNLYDPWAKEILSIMPQRKYSILQGTKKQRLEKLEEDADIYLINHDGVKVIQNELQERTDISALVLDELAVYRNSSDRSKGMRKFAQRFATVWGLTGAPMPNEVTDVWAQAQIITPHTVPKYFRTCREMLMTRVSQYVWKPKPGAVEQAFHMLQPSVRFTLDDVVELPEIIHRMVDVELSEEQDAAFKELKKHLVLQLKDNRQIIAQNAGAIINKLLQIAGGWCYSHQPAFVGFNPEPRLNALVDLVESASRKVLVFAPYTHTLYGLAERFKVSGIDCCMVYGATKGREKIFYDFQNTPLYKVMVADPRTTGHGLTFTAADTVIWYIPIPDLDIFQQANARIRRVGQMHKQQIFMLQATGVEKRFYGILESKQKIQEKFLDLIEEATNER